MGTDAVESNYEQVVLDLLARVKRLEGASVVASELSEISSDIGLIEGGELRIHSDWADPKEPGDGFSGVRILGTFEYPEGSGNYYAIVGVNNDALTFGLSSVDGSAIFCSGNATIDQNGISGTDLLKWMIKQAATQDTYTRTGKLGMALEEGGGEVPVWELSYESPGTGDTIDNGTFETGDFTNWTKTTETACSWTISTQERSGSYAALCSRDSTATVTGKLTSDAISVTGSTSYIITGYSKRYTGELGYGSATVGGSIKAEWYDVGASLLSTDTVGTFSSTPYDTWVMAEATLVAPVAATTLKVTLNVNMSSTGTSPTRLFDDITVEEIAVSQKLHLTDDGLATTNGMFPHSASMFPEECLATVPLTYTFSASQLYTISGYIAAASANDGDEYLYYCMLEKGTYTLDYIYLKGTSGGKADIYVDDVKVVSLLDHYASGTTYNQRSTTNSISVTYSGRHEIKLKVNGKHASSGDYILTHSKLTMTRTGA